MNALRLTKTALSIVLAIVMVGAVVAVAVTSPRVTLPQPPEPSAASAVELPPSEVRQACLAGPYAEGKQEGDEEFGERTAASRTLTSLTVLPRQSAAGSAAYTRQTDGQRFDFSGTPAAILSLDNEHEPGIVAAQPSGGARPALVGGTATINTAGDLRGLTAMTCASPITDAWLLGGATTVGASAELVLTNPGQTVATATIEAYSERGALPEGSVARTSVAPGKTEKILLESSISEIERLALHIKVDGGALVPAIVTHRLDGIIAKGSAIVSPGAGAERTQLVSGVHLAGGSGDVLRLVNPGDEVATVKVTMLSAEGATTLPGAESLAIDAGAVQDIDLAALAEGDYSIEVESNQPVLAAAATHRDGEGGVSSTAWIPSATAGRELYVPGIAEAGITAHVAITAPSTSGASVTYRPVAANGAVGEEARLEIPAGSVRVPSLPEGTRAVQLSANVPISAASILDVAGEGGTMSAALPAIVDSDVRRTVTVRLGDFD
ncbi:hypothetical protein BSZ39_01315 [Bowdeniella nasicola]|uniref:Secreted protein n=1 Tax=Bowdeniella nasicola TaxID=208480 RepID=A0A1Q5Q582_9ACTO|nr:DUF5719 family protein [Bowdeniella nasicola]OKL54943.1 hypothetical protein BSZ39_01315 [Bowdeniella nasicola]